MFPQQIVIPRGSPVTPWTLRGRLSTLHSSRQTPNRGVAQRSIAHSIFTASHSTAAPSIVGRGLTAGSLNRAPETCHSSAKCRSAAVRRRGCRPPAVAHSRPLAGGSTSPLRSSCTEQPTKASARISRCFRRLHAHCLIQSPRSRARAPFPQRLRRRRALINFAAMKSILSVLMRAGFQPGDVVSHDDEIAFAPIPTDHEVVQNRFVLEPIPLDQGDRSPLVNCHLRHDLFDTKI
jgi:hypothetical protein